jgi:DNA polymerase III gamma/tau subunit
VEESLIESCIEALATEDVSTTLAIIETLKERHVQVRSFFDQMMYALRDLMVAHLDESVF